MMCVMPGKMAPPPIDVRLAVTGLSMAIEANNDGAPCDRGVGDCGVPIESTIAAIDDITTGDCDVDFLRATETSLYRSKQPPDHERVGQAMVQ